MNGLSTYETALLCAKNYGFAVFPTYGIKKIIVADGAERYVCTCGVIECSSPGKHPAVGKGRNAASKNEMVIQNLWAGRDFLNIAIATGVESGIFVVDVDGIIGEESLATLEEEHGKLPKTLTCITGRGRHLLFNYPARKVFNRSSALGLNVDIRGEGGYIVGVNSFHISGIQYKWEDENSYVNEAPYWLLEMVCANSKAPVVHEEVLNFDNPRDWMPEDISSMLDFIDPDMSQDEWVKIGMAIHDGGFSFDLFDRWSKRGSKYGGTAKAWKSFKPGGGITIGTLVHAAQIRGWKPENYITSEKVDWNTHPAKNWYKELGIYSPPVDEHLVSRTVKDIRNDSSKYRTEIPIDIYHDIEGIVGETVRWICDTSIKPQPVLALLNTLACLGAVFGRRYASPINTRTNLFTVGIAKTGSGKDFSRRKLKEVMKAVGLDSYIASDEIKSAQGICTTLAKTPACIMMLDEFGLVLQSISGDKAPSYKAEISDILLKIYTSSGDTYKAGMYADPKMEQVSLKDPHLSIYGTTTLDTYIKALKKISIQAGNLNRFIVLPGDDKPERRYEDAKRGVPDLLLEMWKSIVPTGPGISGLNSMAVEHSIKEVGWGETKEYINFLWKTEDKRINAGERSETGELWVRFVEHTIKIAMIFAICRSPNSPILQVEDVKAGEKIVQSGIEYVIDLAMNFMYENELEKTKKNILTLIRKSGKNGIGRAELMRNSGSLKTRDFDDLIKTLIEEERIEAEMGRKGMKNKVVYKVASQ